MKADAAKIKSMGKIGFGLPLGPEEAQAESLLWFLGDGGGYQTAAGKYTINSPQNISAFTFLKGLVSAGDTEPHPGTQNRTPLWQQFAQGKIGMINGSPALVPIIQQAGVLKAATGRRSPMRGQERSAQPRRSACATTSPRSRPAVTGPRSRSSWTSPTRPSTSCSSTTSTTCCRRRPRPPTSCRASKLRLVHQGAAGVDPVPVGHRLGADQDPGPEPDRDRGHRQPVERARRAAEHRAEGRRAGDAGGGLDGGIRAGSRAPPRVGRPCRRVDRRRRAVAGRRPGPQLAAEHRRRRLRRRRRRRAATTASCGTSRRSRGWSSGR